MVTVTFLSDGKIIYRLVFGYPIKEKKYKDMRDGIAEMPKYRIDKLEEIGFQWSLRNIRRVTAAEKSHGL